MAHLRKETCSSVSGFIEENVFFDKTSEKVYLAISVEKVLNIYRIKIELCGDITLGKLYFEITVEKVFSHITLYSHTHTTL